MNFPGRYVFGSSKHALSRDLTEDAVDFGHANWITYVFVRIFVSGSRKDSPLVYNSKPTKGMLR